MHLRNGNRCIRQETDNLPDRACSQSAKVAAARRCADKLICVADDRIWLLGGACVGELDIHIAVQDHDVWIRVTLIVREPQQAVRCIGVAAQQRCMVVLEQNDCTGKNLIIV